MKSVLIHSIWSPIEATTLVNSVGDDRLKDIKNIISEKLYLQYSKKYFNTYTLPPIYFQDGSSVNDIDIRISHNPSNPPFLVFNQIQGRCINVEEIKLHYKSLKFNSSASNSSPGAENTWKAIVNHVPVYFGFANRNQECMNSVSIHLDKRGVSTPANSN